MEVHGQSDNRQQRGGEKRERRSNQVNLSFFFFFFFFFLACASERHVLLYKREPWMQEHTFGSLLSSPRALDLSATRGARSGASVELVVLEVVVRFLHQDAFLAILLGQVVADFPNHQRHQTR